jgi:hypothetical protein
MGVAMKQVQQQIPSEVAVQLCSAGALRLLLKMAWIYGAWSMPAGRVSPGQRKWGPSVAGSLEVRDCCMQFVQFGAAWSVRHHLCS